jgi:nitroreductase
MDFTEVIRTRRSVRSYSDKPVPEDALKRVLEAAHVAPSANNTQPWHYIVVKDAEKREAIAHLSADQGFIAQAPVVIVCVGKRYHDQWSWIGENMYLVDCAISLDHLLLAARNEGLGTCWIGAIGAASQKELQKLLKIPHGQAVFMLTPLGYPKSPGAFRPALSRMPFDQMVSYETF